MFDEIYIHLQEKDKNDEILKIILKLQVAQMIGEDLVKKVLELFADELNLFAKDFEGT